jgi:hypothetical protein
MKSGSLQKLFVFGSVILLLSACSMEASIQSLIDDIKVLKAPGQAQGISSGAVQAKTATGGSGYIVSSSVGFLGASTYTAGPTATSLVHTTASGLKVYSSVQGAIVAE